MSDFTSSPNLMNDHAPMMTSNPGLNSQPADLAPTPSVTPSKFKLHPKKTGLRILLPVLLLAVVGVAVAAGMVLVNRSQDVRQQASGGPEYSCASNSGLFSSLVPNSVPCLWEGAPYYRCKVGYKNENNGCVLSSDETPATTSTSSGVTAVSNPRPNANLALLSSPSPVAQICSSEVGLFLSPISNSHICYLKGARYFECNSGYKNENNSCVSQDVVQPASGEYRYSCGRSGGLFSSLVPNSVPCLWEDIRYYRCKDGYKNENNSCVSQDVVQPASGEYRYSCGRSGGLFSSLVPNSVPCLWEDIRYYRCKDGYKNENNSCRINEAAVVTGTPVQTANPFPAPVVVTTFRVVGTAPNLTCEQCVNAGECGYTIDTCRAHINTLNSQRVCYAAGNCSVDLYKEACNNNEYSSAEECFNSTNEAITYRLTGTIPNVYCQLCANPAECGYTNDTCRAAMREINTKQYCYPAGSCSISFPRQSCLANEYTTYEGCLAGAVTQTTGTGSLTGGTITGK